MCKTPSTKYTCYTKIVIFGLLGFSNFATSLALFILSNMHFDQTFGEQFIKFVISTTLLSTFNWWMLKDVIQ